VATFRGFLKQKAQEIVRRELKDVISISRDDEEEDSPSLSPKAMISQKVMTCLKESRYMSKEDKKVYFKEIFAYIIVNKLM